LLHCNKLLLAAFRRNDSDNPMANPAAAILIAGPTASGKSALALRLADALGGVIVNADSMQVYRDLRTGSTAMSMRRRTIRSAAGAAMSARCWANSPAPGTCRSWWAAPGSISRR
jgi:hypothetical protein